MDATAKELGAQAFWNGERFSRARAQAWVDGWTDAAADLRRTAEGAALDPIRDRARVVAALDAAARLIRDLMPAVPRPGVREKHHEWQAAEAAARAAIEG